MDIGCPVVINNLVKTDLIPLLSFHIFHPTSGSFLKVDMHLFNSLKKDLGIKTFLEN